MRTTLDIDDDVLRAAKERARAEGKTTGRVLSELARESLTRMPDGGEDEEFYGFVPLPSRGVQVTDADVETIREAEGI
jgi:hypothetical protein